MISPRGSSYILGCTQSERRASGLCVLRTLSTFIIADDIFRLCSMLTLSQPRLWVSAILNRRYCVNTDSSKFHDIHHFAQKSTLEPPRRVQSTTLFIVVHMCGTWFQLKIGSEFILSKTKSQIIKILYIPKQKYHWWMCLKLEMIRW